MKKKSIIAICAVLVILVLAAVLVLTGNRGNISNVNRVVGYSALYGENSINEAFDVIEEKFAKDFEGCALTELRYDKDVENRFAEEIESNHKENNQELIVKYYQPLYQTKKVEMEVSILMIHTTTGNVFKWKRQIKRVGK